MTTEKTFTITLTERELSIVGFGLKKAPYELAEPLLQSIGKQVKDQMSPPETPDIALPVKQKIKKNDH